MDTFQLMHWILFSMPLHLGFEPGELESLDTTQLCCDIHFQHPYDYSDTRTGLVTQTNYLRTAKILAFIAMVKYSPVCYIYKHICFWDWRRKTHSRMYPGSCINLFNPSSKTLRAICIKWINHKKYLCSSTEVKLLEHFKHYTSYWMTATCVGLYWTEEDEMDERA